MGLRATVIKKYEVEYGNKQGFNYDPETIIRIINEFCDEFFYGDNGYGEYSTDSIWEVNKEQFASMLQKLRDMSEDEFNRRMEEEWFFGAYSDDKPYSKKYVLDVFEGWLAETPKDSCYVRFGWL